MFELAMHSHDAGADVSTRPYCPDVGVIALVPDEWISLWQPRHHLLTPLSQPWQPDRELAGPAAAREPAEKKP